MKTLRCPYCEALIRATTTDSWTTVRTFAGVHLRSCVRLPEGFEPRTQAIRIADEAVPEAKR